MELLFYEPSFLFENYLIGIGIILTEPDFIFETIE
jgi:hypothetical protein